MILLDTSVFLAIAHVHHESHPASLKLWTSCVKQETAVSTHSLAEIYSGLTSMPKGFRLSPRAAATAIDTFLLRATPVGLTAEEYLQVIGSASLLGIAGGSIYDALHVACARKAGAERIYTWNVRDFQRVAPDLAEKIATP